MVKCRPPQNNDGRKCHFSCAVMFSVSDELQTETLLATLEKRWINARSCLTKQHSYNFCHSFCSANSFCSLTESIRALAFQHLAVSSILYVTNWTCLAVLFLMNIVDFHAPFQEPRSEKYTGMWMLASATFVGSFRSQPSVKCNNWIFCQDV